MTLVSFIQVHMYNSQGNIQFATFHVCNLMCGFADQCVLIERSLNYQSSCKDFQRAPVELFGKYALHICVGSPPVCKQVINNSVLRIFGNLKYFRCLYRKKHLFFITTVYLSLLPGIRCLPLCLSASVFRDVFISQQELYKLWLFSHIKTCVYL